MEVSKRLWIGMVVLAAGARLLPHPWNFTPVIAMALFAGSHARKTGIAALATLSALVLSDAILGFSGDFWFVYAATLVPVLLGRLIRNKPGVAAVGSAALASSLSFFVITNFMVWATGGLYPHTASGLATSFVAGIPFYQNQVLGDAFYTVALFGGYALLSRAFRPVPQAA
jgi:hypothetical protein